MLQEIETKRVFPHPGNPREGVGDIGELTESIAAQGVLQNLTVVPASAASHLCPGLKDGDYVVVIGHRRLAAAKAAGLASVPCSVVEMGPKEQVGTMLAENLQREDLTVIEQARGFQMMIDLGGTVKGIAGQTGFSEKTVRRRIEIAKLPEGKVRKGMEAGATLFDFMALGQVKDPKTREKLLDDIGTNNFTWELERAVRAEEVERNQTRIEEMLKARGLSPLPQGVPSWKYKNAGAPVLVKDSTSDADVIIEEGALYYSSVNSRFCIYGDIEDRYKTEADTSAADAARADAAGRNAALGEICSRMYALRTEFARNVPKRELDRNKNEVFRAVLALCCAGMSPQDDEALGFFGIDGEDGCPKDEDGNLDIAALVESRQSGWVHGLFAIAYCAMEHKRYCWHYHYSYRGELAYIENPGRSPVAIYPFLETFGYQMSDEERMVVDGTHPLYTEGGGSGDGV